MTDRTTLARLLRSLADKLEPPKPTPGVFPEPQVCTVDYDGVPNGEGPETLHVCGVTGPCNGWKRKTPYPGF